MAALRSGFITAPPALLPKIMRLLPSIVEPTGAVIDTMRPLPKILTEIVAYDNQLACLVVVLRGSSSRWTTHSFSGINPVAGGLPARHLEPTCKWQQTCLAPMGGLHGLLRGRRGSPAAGQQANRKVRDAVARRQRAARAWKRWRRCNQNPLAQAGGFWFRSWGVFSTARDLVISRNHQFDDFAKSLVDL